MSPLHRYPEVTVEGGPRELGQQIGEAFREQIRGFCSIALERVNKSVSVTRQKATDVARRSQRYAEEYRPDLVDELKGTAEATSLALDDLMLLQVRNQLQAEKAGGCTSVALAPDVNISAGPIVAQTWDNDPLLDQFTVVLTRKPYGKPAQISCTQAGLISYMGFSETGIGACVNTLPAPARETGVPHYFILREMYEANSLAETVQSLSRAQRAIPVNIMLATPDGPADIEATTDTICVMRPIPEQHQITHTNHCLHADLTEINKDFAELAQSYSRQERVECLMQEYQHRPNLDELKQILSDHANFPTSICRHASDDPDTGFWETVFAIIIEPGKRRMSVSRGNPCEHPFATYYLQ